MISALIFIQRLRVTFLTAFALAFCLASLTAHSAVTFVSVEAEGFGPRKSDAIADALIQAISQINGAEVGGQTMRSLKEESSESSEGNDYLLQETFQSKVSMKSKGLVKSWSTVAETQDSGTGLWTVKIAAMISRYSGSKQLKRLRMAVVPLRVDPALDASAMGIADTFSSALQDGLTKTRKFAMLDRSFIHEQNTELAKIQGGGFPTEELARLGNRAGTDYLIVGQLKRASQTESTIQSRLTGREIKVKNAQVVVSYRIIDVATTQLKYSDEISGQAQDQAIEVLSKRLAHQAAEKILNAIFPIRVVAIEGQQITLAQGGDMLQVGQKMQLVKLGKPLIDPYTKESLGRQETVIGEVELIQVQSRASTAKVLASREGYEGLNLIVRPIDGANGTARAQGATVSQNTEGAKVRMKSLLKDSQNDW